MHRAPPALQLAQSPKSHARNTAHTHTHTREMGVTQIRKMRGVMMCIMLFGEEEERSAGGGGGGGVGGGRALKAFFNEDTPSLQSLGGGFSRDPFEGCVHAWFQFLQKTFFR